MLDVWYSPVKVKFLCNGTTKIIEMENNIQVVFLKPG